MELKTDELSNAKVAGLKNRKVLIILGDGAHVAEDQKTNVDQYVKNAADKQIQKEEQNVVNVSAAIKSQRKRQFVLYAAGNC